MSWHSLGPRFAGVGLNRASIVPVTKNGFIALGISRSLPSMPPDIPQMQAKRTAIMVQHVVKLQSSLGSQTTAQLNAYLHHEFVPHISLKALAKPPSGLPNASGPQGVYSEGH